jgi:hypothetical protein
VETIEPGDEGNGGSSAGSSLTKLRGGWTESWSMLRLRIRSYREGRAFKRGLRPTFINPQVEVVYQLDSGVELELLWVVPGRREVRDLGEL